ncbi:MFS transporter [Streptomyces sp. NRRL S-813]|uniref:MFS transporter n=1 Tax=Streptomyces sp. NRRL S-813 TaxID=1463919 RepID=UPI00099BADB5|nr:MFS transporter [Streptomyces sp. NRRL S-813]
MNDNTVAARLDRLPVTRIHLMAVLVVGLGMFFDLYEVFLAGTVSTALKDDFHVSDDQLKPLLASAFVGAFLGAVVMSRIADRLGRRRAFYLTLAIYSLFSVLAAFSPNVEMLIVCRFLAGLGIGGELPLCDAYLSDLLPARARGRLIGWAYTVGFCGVPLAGFLALGIVPHSYAGVAGWRWMFLIGGLGAAVCWILRRQLPESPRWLEAVGRHEEADRIVRAFEAAAHSNAGTQPVPEQRPLDTATAKAPLRTLVTSPWRTRTAMLVVFQILQVFGYYGFGTLAPLVLASKGYDIVHSLTFSALSFVGYPIGSLLSIPILERIERKHLVMLSAFGMLAFGLGFGYAHSTAVIVALGIGYTLTSNLFSNAYHVYQGELFPTRLRATGAGTAYSLSRLASAAMPYVLLPLLVHHGANAVFAFIACAMTGVILDIGFFGPRTTGRSVDEVSDTMGADTPGVVAAAGPSAPTAIGDRSQSGS